MRESGDILDVSPPKVKSLYRVVTVFNRSAIFAEVEMGRAYGYDPYKRSEVHMSKTTSRQARIELRTTSDEKDLLARAAAYEHLDVTSFILRTAVPAAREVINRAEHIVLDEQDTRMVLELLENPPKPTPELLDAARGYLANRDPRST